ncbi:MAG: NAD(P)/FAD-dependent oxidoreductase [Mobilicoccus sp.]|nr:NAD(P)/FAD-dependent oxidoreductase [Mobilicoccus sp.]
MNEVDVAIVGAGLSGIDVAYRLQEARSGTTFALLEAREAVGGTWDLFRYPGIRSDSDIDTLSYPFHPWTGEDAIVSGDAIRDYLHEVVRRHRLDEHLHLRTRVSAASWSSEDARWTLTLDGPDGRAEMRCRFVVVSTGYYDYEHPHDPDIPGLADFDGTVVHPQFWPEDLDVAGRRVVVIGSGATAITLVPALADRGADVTMLQRTPTYVIAQPRRDPLAAVARRVLPAGLAGSAVRAKNTAIQRTLYRVAQARPTLVKAMLRRDAVRRTGSEALVETHLTPPYDPWDQRLCVAPDGDFFAALAGGQARIVTGRIDRVVPEGVRLEDGTLVAADIVVTATGLRVKLLGEIPIDVDGTPFDPADSIIYQGAMLSGLPNAGIVVGYINASWTLRADATARFLARVVTRLLDAGLREVRPVPPGVPRQSRPLMDMEAGYLLRAADRMPRKTGHYPWTMEQDPQRDPREVARADLDDGLHWR